MSIVAPDIKGVWQDKNSTHPVRHQKVNITKELFFSFLIAWLFLSLLKSGASHWKFYLTSSLTIPKSYQHFNSLVGGGRGRAGDREKRGRLVYGRREKRWWETGEKGKNYATLRNISQSKKCKGAEAKKYRAGTGIKGYGKREVQTPLFPPPPLSLQYQHMINLPKPRRLSQFRFHFLFYFGNNIFSCVYNCARNF